MSTKEKGYFERMADIALLHCRQVTDEQLRRQVIGVLREVERDTRHRAHEIIQECAGEIVNMTPPR